MLNAILQKFPWFDHPEGMKFAEMYRDEFRTVGHWLFLPGSMSAFHRVNNCDEVWAIHVGQITLHVLDGNGGHTQVRLGTDVASGEVPVTTVPRGAWQAAELTTPGSWAFGTNICAPGFEYAECDLASRDQLVVQFPTHRELICSLTPAPKSSHQSP